MSPKVECVNCHQIVAMDSMKMHEDVCGGGGLSATLDESYRYILLSPVLWRLVNWHVYLQIVYQK